MFIDANLLEVRIIELAHNLLKPETNLRLGHSY
jgi:hypothetical protein